MRLIHCASISFLLLVGLTGCSRANPAGVVPGTQDHVYLRGTPDYSRQALAFKINPDQARQIAAQNVDKSIDVVPEPSCIIGRYYVWPWRSHDDFLELWGPRVNGDTGEWLIWKIHQYPCRLMYGSFGSTKFEVIVIPPGYSPQ
ncbi:MAG: hypothetical protein JWP03_1897 [Phycisphaerales bacterium]|nr:hypothetical protein [Phycisphaerales bacterium]